MAAAPSVNYNSEFQSITLDSPMSIKIVELMHLENPVGQIASVSTQ